MHYSLAITPALTPEKRHKIEDKLKELGYVVYGGGTRTDMSECDISFEKEVRKEMAKKGGRKLGGAIKKGGKKGGVIV